MPPNARQGRFCFSHIKRELTWRLAALRYQAAIAQAFLVLADGDGRCRWSASEGSRLETPLEPTPCVGSLQP